MSSYSERLFQVMADLLITEGYAAAGYEYVNVDDCWLEKHRSPNGQLIADRSRFPSGMRALSDYVSKCIKPDFRILFVIIFSFFIIRFIQKV